MLALQFYNVSVANDEPTLLYNKQSTNIITKQLNERDFSFNCFVILSVICLFIKEN